MSHLFTARTSNRLLRPVGVFVLSFVLAWEIRTERGTGALVLELTRYESGALELRDARSGSLIRQWTPKEVRSG